MNLSPVYELLRQRGIAFVANSNGTFWTNCPACKRPTSNFVELGGDGLSARWRCDCGFSGVERVRSAWAKPDGKSEDGKADAGAATGGAGGDAEASGDQAPMQDEPAPSAAGARAQADGTADHTAAGETGNSRGTTAEENTFTAEAPVRKQGGRITRPGGTYMDSKVPLAGNLGNALLALEQEPELVGVFGYDEMLRTEVLLRPLFNSEPNFKPRPVTDADAARVQEHLHWLGMRKLGKDTTHDAINTHARAHSFHPVRNYLNRLKWDGKGRLRTWLGHYLGAKQDDEKAKNSERDKNYLEEVGTMFLISMVARIYQPGCKCDYMPILEGPQGLIKSLACKALAGEEYFSDQLSDITKKDASQHLRGKWVLELAELHTYSRADVDHFKAFVTRTTERYRPPWARKEVIEPRQCVFVGTTNKQAYLRDETGNRRYWPLKTGEIILEALIRDRDQLLAEAVNLYRAGVPWWPDRAFELQHIVPEQEARFETDIWHDKIATFLATETEVTVTDVAEGALNVELDLPTSKDDVRGTPLVRLGTADQRRITSVLTKLGWVHGNRDGRGRQLWIKGKT